MNLNKSDFFYQIVALILSFIVVHTLYVGLVRPNAEAVLEAERQLVAQQAETGGIVKIERSAWVVLKDYEQESCFILMLWVMAIIGLKAQGVYAQRRLMLQSLLNIDEGRRVLPEDARKLSRPLEALPEPQRGFLLPRVLRTALARYGASSSIQEVSNVIRDTCEVEADRLDS